MKKTTAILFAIPLLLSARVVVTADKATAGVGEEITFTINSGSKNGGKKLFVTFDGSAKLRAAKRQIIADNNGKAVVVISGDRPGSVYCKASLGGKAQKNDVPAGVAIDREKVVPGIPAPADFNAYWDAVKAEMDKRPMDAVVKPVKSGNPKVVALDVQLPMGGADKDAYAYLTLPAGAKAKSLPALLIVHGAGTDRVRPVVDRALENGGMLVLTLNPMPVRNDGNNGDFIKRGKYRGYRRSGASDREKIFFNGMFRRLYRALQYIKSRPEWDGKILIARGGSQGGGQALAAGGLDPQVSCVVAHVPAICNHGGFAAGGDAGWPQYFRCSEYRKNPKKVLTASSYIDAVNFARNIKKADVFISVGFIDRTCPPESVFAAFNVIPSVNKEIFCTPTATHRVAKPAMARGEVFIKEHIKRNK